jgi:adhesin transport system outer membrane protein
MPRALFFMQTEPFKRGAAALLFYNLLMGLNYANAQELAERSVVAINQPKQEMGLAFQLLPIFSQDKIKKIASSEFNQDALIAAVNFMIGHVTAPVPKAGKNEFVEAVRYAVMTHPAIKSAIADVSAATAGTNESFSGFLPQVSGIGEAGYKSYGTSAALNNTPVQKSRSPNVGMTLRQLLFDFGATSSVYDASIAREQQASADFVAARSEYALRAITSYVDVLRMRSHNALAEQNVTARKGLLDQVTERAKSGGGSEADVTRAEGRFVESLANAASVRNRLSSAESQFSEVFGRKAPDVLPIPIDPDVKNADQPLDVLLRSYSPAKSKDAARRAAELDADAVKNRALPKLEFQVSHTRNQWNEIGGVGRVGSDTTAVVAMKYDFFTGGADKARSEQAAYRASKAAMDFELVTRQFERSLTQARADVKSTTEIQSSRVRSAKAAVRSMEAVNEQFHFNRGSLLDAIKTQEELYAAGKDMIDSVADRILSKYRLLFFSSQLDDVFDLAEISSKIIMENKKLSGALQESTVGKKEKAKNPPRSGEK